MVKSERTHRRALWLARFWNYGYFLICGLGMFIHMRFAKPSLATAYIALIGWVSIFLVYGICHIIIAVQWRRSFVYSMQMSRKKYRPNIHMFWPPDKNMQREGILMGCISIGIALLFIGVFLYEHHIFPI